MQVEEYISELLFDNDCVIVPDFGGFIGNYAHARIDPVKHLFEPPRKKILFNKGLTQNDGLLATHISNSRSISYAEAVSFITKEVKRLQEEIKQVKRLVLDNIGVLYTDEKGNLLFQPDEKVNYLPEAFGLSAFYHLPVEQEEKAEEGKVVQLNRPTRRIRTYAAAAVIGAVIASTFWISFSETKLGTEFSNLNIFAKKEAAQYTIVNRESIQNIPNAKDSVSAIAFLTPPPKAAVDNTAPGNYLIIAGCFRFSENAQNFVRTMSQKNANVSVVGKNPQGLYMIGYGNYKTREEAEAQLPDFRKNFIAGAWVCERPKM
jgi:hypothetical protein